MRSNNYAYFCGFSTATILFWSVTGNNSIRFIVSPRDVILQFALFLVYHSYKRDDSCKMHNFQSLSCFSHSYMRDLIFTKTRHVLIIIFSFPTATNAIWYSQKAPVSHIFPHFPHKYKRDLIFTKSANCIHSVVFPTATSAVWYSQKVAIMFIPLFFPGLQARFDIHKKWQLRPFCCFPHFYKRDLMLIDSRGFTHSRVFPAFPTVLHHVYPRFTCVRNQ